MTVCKGMTMQGTPSTVSSFCLVIVVSSLTFYLIHGTETNFRITSRNQSIYNVTDCFWKKKLNCIIFSVSLKWWLWLNQLLQFMDGKLPKRSFRCFNWRVCTVIGDLAVWVKCAPRQPGLGWEQYSCPHTSCQERLDPPAVFFIL